MKHIPVIMVLLLKRCDNPGHLHILMIGERMGGKRIFFGVENLAKRDFFGCMKDAGIFWVAFQKICNKICWCNKTEIFLVC